MKINKKNKTIDDREIQNRIIEISDQIQKDESDSSAPYLAGLDKLVAKKIYQTGNKNLARNIMKNSKKNLPKRKGSFLFDFALYTSGMSMMLAAFVLVLVFVEINNKNTGQTDSRIEYGTQLIEAMFQPSDLTQGGYVAQNSALTITVPGEITGDPKGYISIAPEVDFSVTQQALNGDTVLTITPAESLEKGEEYALTFADPTIAEVTNAVTWVIDIDPDLEVVEVSPSNGQTNIPIDGNIAIKYNSDQIDIPSADVLFVISPDIYGETYMEDGAYIFNPKGSLLPNTTYTITLKAGIYGINSEELKEDYSFSFTTSKLNSTGNWVSNNEFYFYEGEEPETVSGSISSFVSAKDVSQIDFYLYEINYDIAQSLLLNGYPYVWNFVPENSYVYSTSVTGDESFQFGYDNVKSGYYLLIAQNTDGSQKIYKMYNVTDYTVIEYEENMWLYDLNENKLILNATVSCLNLNGTLTNALLNEIDGVYKVTPCDVWVVNYQNEKIFLLDTGTSGVNLSGKSQKVEINYGILNGNSSEYKVEVNVDNPVVLSGEKVKASIKLLDLNGGFVANKQVNVTMLPIVEVSNTKGVMKYSNVSASQTVTTNSTGTAFIEMGPLANGTYDMVLKVEGDGVIRLSNAFEVANLYTTIPKSVSQNIFLYINNGGDVNLVANKAYSGIVISDVEEEVDSQLIEFVGNQKMLTTKFESNDPIRDRFCVVVFSDSILYECI